MIPDNMQFWILEGDKGSSGDGNHQFKEFKYEGKWTIQEQFNTIYHI